jgi:hypothetical protein
MISPSDPRLCRTLPLPPSAFCLYDKSHGTHSDDATIRGGEEGLSGGDIAFSDGRFL